jgi:hypothetical protein
MGDGFVLEAVAGLYKKKKDMKKGVAFPTCVSVNHCVCAYSPVDDDAVLAAGDLVKIDLGCHVDGYIGVVAGSTVVGASAEEPASGKAADVLAAAYIGAEAILRLVKPGAKVRSEQKIPAPRSDTSALTGCRVLAEHGHPGGSGEDRGGPRLLRGGGRAVAPDETVRSTFLLLGCVEWLY